MDTNGYPLDALDAVHRAQSRKGWSDRTTLAQCLVHVVDHFPSIYDRECVGGIVDDLRALPGDAADAERVQVVAHRLELCWGYFGSEWLDESLARQPGLSEGEVTDVIIGFPGPTSDPRIGGSTREMDPRFRTPRDSKTWAERRAAMRQPLLIIACSLAAMVALAVAIVLLGGG